jgi:hypothetical protein
MFQCCPTVADTPTKKGECLESASPVHPMLMKMSLFLDVKLYSSFEKKVTSKQKSTASGIHPNVYLADILS